MTTQPSELTFPDLGSQMSVRAAGADQHGRRSWVISVHPDATRTIEGFFSRCRGRLQAFTLATPTGDKIRARFDTDSLPMTQISKGVWRCEPFSIIELIGE
jgi:hypothetical protein